MSFLQTIKPSALITDSAVTTVGGAVPAILTDGNDATYVQGDWVKTGFVLMKAQTFQWTRVTAFPGGPSNGQIVLRTDLDQFFVYDSTYAGWVEMRIAGIRTHLRAVGSGGGGESILATISTPSGGFGAVLPAAAGGGGSPGGSGGNKLGKTTEYKTIPGGIGAVSNFPMADMPGGWSSRSFIGAEWDPVSFANLHLALRTVQPDPILDAAGVSFSNANNVITDPAATPLWIGRALWGTNLGSQTAPTLFIGTAVSNVSYGSYDSTNAAHSPAGSGTAANLGGCLVQIAEAYLELDLRGASIASAVTVDRTATTAQQPTISWSQYDPDLDGPNAFQVRIFAGATADPDVDTPMWDSGVMYSTALSGLVQVDQPLPTNTQYTCYVRTSKAFLNDVWFEDELQSATNAGGWVQMSHTDAGAATSWTIPLTGPTVPTIAVAFDGSNWRNTLTASSSDSTGAGYANLTFQIQVSVDGGVTWTNVRQCGAIDPTNNANPFWSSTVGGIVTAYDWEPKTGVLHQYRVRAAGTAGANSDPVASAWSAIVSDTPAITQFLIRDPYKPDGWLPLPVADLPTETTKHPSSVDYPLGANLPIVVLGTPTGRDWAFTVNQTIWAGWPALRQLLNGGAVLLLYDPVHATQYYVAVVADVTTTHATRPGNPWQSIPIQLVETGPPPDADG